MSVKLCTSCKSEKDFAEFYKRKASRDGLQPSCKTCIDEKDTIYRATNKEKISAQQAKFRTINRETARARASAWYLANKEKAISCNSAYRKADPTKAKACLLRWRTANSERFKASLAAYAKANPHIFAANNARRKAIKLRATPVWADHEIMADFYQEAAYFKCQVDHIVPLRSKFVCGLHWEGNMQLLSGAENLAKGNRHWPDMPSS